MPSFSRTVITVFLAYSCKSQTVGAMSTERQSETTLSRVCSATRQTLAQVCTEFELRSANLVQQKLLRDYSLVTENVHIYGLFVCNCVLNDALMTNGLRQGRKPSSV